MNEDGVSNRNLPSGPVGGKRDQWLSLKDASDFLGVHYTTLRNWADQGELPVFRTPGGHRRFSAHDLRRFLNERVSQPVVPDSESFVTAAVGRVRMEIQNMPTEQMAWRGQMDDAGRDLRRERGRQLFALAISFVLKPNQRERTLNDARQLGSEYGREAALNNVSLKDTGRAVQFFRNQLTQVVHHDEQGSVLDPDDVRLQRLLDQFLDEVLYAVLDGYEENLTFRSD